MQALKKEVIELWAFYSNPEFLRAIDSHLMTGFIVDLEKKGKDLRQQLYNTQITEHGLDDLKTARELTKSSIICRINPQSTLDKAEVQSVVDGGADEILLPMVSTLAEVENVLHFVDGRVKVGVMLETKASIAIIEELDKLPLSRFYVGLNDLAIENKHQNIFTPLVDGTIEHIRPKIHKKFAVAGLTHPDMGHPIPCEVLIRIMKRLRCNYGILRRSFYRDLDKVTSDDILQSLTNSFLKEEPLTKSREADNEAIIKSFS